MRIKLNKRDFNKCPVYSTPTWIGNGHWAIRLSCVEDAELWTTQRYVEGKNLRWGGEWKDRPEMFPDNPRRRYTWTGFIHAWTNVKACELLIYRNDEGAVLRIDKVYADLLGRPYQLYAEGPLLPCFEEETWDKSRWVVMPVSLGSDFRWPMNKEARRQPQTKGGGDGK